MNKINDTKLNLCFRVKLFTRDIDTKYKQIALYTNFEILSGVNIDIYTDLF